jgi:3-methyladenine DNA glycosylase AlkD
MTELKEKLIVIIEKLKSLADPNAALDMARYGINTKTAYGVSIPDLRKIAKNSGKSHALARELWQSGIHEARILASMIDEPALVTAEQMNLWAKDFDSWDLCDQCCNNLFYKTSFAYQKAFEWSSGKSEFVKRAGFVMIAALSVHDKKAGDDKFEKFLPVIKRESADDRVYVKKAVNWALRQIGKRNMSLNKKAMNAANEILRIDSKTAKWIASDAIRELASRKIQERLINRELNVN